MVAFNSWRSAVSSTFFRCRTLALNVGIIILNITRKGAMSWTLTLTLFHPLVMTNIPVNISEEPLFLLSLPFDCYPSDRPPIRSFRVSRSEVNITLPGMLPAPQKCHPSHSTLRDSQLFTPWLLAEDKRKWEWIGECQLAFKYTTIITSLLCQPRPVKCTSL